MSSSPSPRHRRPRATPPARHPGRPAALLTLGAALALTLGACTTGTPDDDDTAPPTSGPAAIEDAEQAGPTYGRYVALGDSFAALGPVDAPTSGPASCLRSSLNYPSLVAAEDSIGEFVDATCGGAQTRDMTARQIPDTPPQFDALTPDTDLVTLSIGGNDISFGAIAGCVASTPRAAIGAPCRDRLEQSVTDALNALPASLDAVYSGIVGRSPDARVITTSYMPLVPDHGGCEFVSRMSPGDVTWTRHVTGRINLIVADAADRADATVVEPSDADERHACAPASERYTDFTGAETGSHPMHPTAAGQQAMADAVEAVL